MKISLDGENQTAMDLNGLDELSRDFAQALLSAHPEWIHHAKAVQSADGGDSYLVVELPSPPDCHVQTGLCITTENDEVTVFFDSFHQHFDGPQYNPYYPAEPLTLIGEIVDERVAVVSGWNGEKWCGSDVVGPDEDSAAWLTRFPSASVIRLRSWHGKFDQEIQIQPPT